MSAATLTRPDAVRAGFALPARVWACYCRLSEAKNDGKGGSLAIDRQCEENALYIHGNDPAGPAARVVHFHDDGYSAFLDVFRPGFEDLMGRTATREFTDVVGWHADRWSRQVEVSGRIWRVTETAGTRLHTALGGKHENPTSFYLESVVAEAESRQKRNRAVSKHDQLRRDGGFSGGARVFGFEPRMKGHRESEAAIVRDIANRLLNGESASGIARWLNENDVPTSRGVNAKTGKRILWTNSTIRSMFTSPHIAGKRVHEGRVIDASWKGIIDVPTHEALKAMFADPDRDPHKGGKQSTYLLSGIARCYKCGGPMGGLKANSRRIAVYKCRENWCTQRGLADVDTTVGDYVVARLEEIDARGALVSDEDARNLAALVLERDETIPTRRKSLAAMWAGGDMADADYREATAALSAREADVNRAIGVLSAQVAAPQRALEGATGPNARAVWDGWTNDPSGAGLARQRAIVALLVDVEIRPQTGRHFREDSVGVTYRDLA
jgi:site-specific DNA recombinase